MPCRLCRSVDLMVRRNNGLPKVRGSLFAHRIPLSSSMSHRKYAPCFTAVVALDGAGATMLDPPTAPTSYPNHRLSSYSQLALQQLSRVPATRRCGRADWHLPPPGMATGGFLLGFTALVRRLARPGPVAPPFSIWGGVRDSDPLCWVSTDVLAFSASACPRRPWGGIGFGCLSLVSYGSHVGFSEPPPGTL